MMRRRYALLIFSVIIFHLISNYIWLKKDYYSFSPEKFYKLAREHEIYMHLRDKTDSLLKDIFRTNTWEVRLFNAYTAGMNRLLGNDSMNNAIMWNMPFMFLALWFVYLIGKALVSPFAGALSSFILAFYPGFYGMSRSYGIDFPLIASMAVVLYCFCRTERFSRISYGLGVGVIISLAILINARVLFYLSGPLVYALLKASRRQLFGIGAAFFLALIVTFPWWHSHAHIAQKELWNNFSVAKFFHSSRPNILGQTQYLIANMVKELSVFLAALLICGVALFKKNIRLGIIIAYCAAPLCIMPFFTAGFDRFFFPLLIGLALLTGIGISSIKVRPLKIAAVLGLVFVCLAQCLDLSFGTKLLPGKAFYRLKSEWARPPEVNDEAYAADRFLGIIKSYKKGDVAGTSVILAGRPDLIDSGVTQYIFLAKADSFMLKRFFDGGVNVSSAEFLIVANDKALKINNQAVPDLSFMDPDNFKGYFEVYYPGIAFSEEQLRKMRGCFETFTLVDRVIANGKAYYLCVNPARR